MEWGERENRRRHRIVTVPSFVIWFIGAFEKFRKATVSLATSVLPSVWNNLAFTNGLSWKFDIENFSKIC